jgi:acetyltransferase-like isoleucine patch superfamily enzyme
MTTSPENITVQSALSLALDTPWKARNEIERLLLIPLAWLSLKGSGIEIGAGWKLYGLPVFQKHRHSTLKIGARLNLRSTRRSNPLGPAHPCILSTRQAGAALIIGDDFGMTGGAIVCQERITIGHRVTVGANTVIVDTDFHPLDPVHRYSYPAEGAAAPVVIEEDVFIGMQALVLKGVTIGARAALSARAASSRAAFPPA